MYRWMLSGILFAALNAPSMALPPVSDSLEIRDQARACYLGFIKLYDVDYLADASNARCVRVSYLRGFSADELSEATTKVFAQRHGSDVAAEYIDLLQGVNSAYDDVDNGDTYTYCVADSVGGVLIRDNEAVRRIDSDDFAKRFFQIWVKDERNDGRPEWSFSTC